MYVQYIFNLQQAEVGRLLEDVVQLYSLLRQAKDFNCQETAVNTDEDADFLVGGDGVKAKKDDAFVALRHCCLGSFYYNFNIINFFI